LLVEQDVFTAFELAQRGFVIELGRVTASGETRVLAEDAKVRQAYMGI
jgi:branched-chain amino acid transport system ATP-binding protein